MSHSKKENSISQLWETKGLFREVKIRRAKIKAVSEEGSKRDLHCKSEFS